MTLKYRGIFKILVPKNQDNFNKSHSWRFMNSAAQLDDLVNKINQYGEDDIIHHIMKASYKAPTSQSEPDLSSSKQKRVDHMQKPKKDKGKTKQLKLGPDSSDPESLRKCKSSTWEKDARIC
uniref:Uncharacterized protein n=1 Tax=Glossina pallidipes TaxID=7398 RepID=A0A1A9ZXC1_GLOPL